MLTSRGDINGALALISKWSEGIARKIMKKAGYSVTPHPGRAFWSWVQVTLTDSARQRRCGYRVRAERRTPVRYSRQQARENYDTYAQMMASDVAPQAEAAPHGEIAPLDAGPEKSVAVCSRTETLIHPGRNGKPAPARAVPVLQLKHAGGRIKARRPEKRRGDVMSVHSVFLLHDAFTPLCKNGHLLPRGKNRYRPGTSLPRVSVTQNAFRAFRNMTSLRPISSGINTP